jgi:hypothetical protein
MGDWDASFDTIGAKYNGTTENSWVFYDLTGNGPVSASGLLASPNGSNALTTPTPSRAWGVSCNSVASDTPMSTSQTTYLRFYFNLYYNTPQGYAIDYTIYSHPTLGELVQGLVIHADGSLGLIAETAGTGIDALSFWSPTGLFTGWGSRARCELRVNTANDYTVRIFQGSKVEATHASGDYITYSGKRYFHGGNEAYGGTPANMARLYNRKIGVSGVDYTYWPSLVLGSSPTAVSGAHGSIDEIAFSTSNWIGGSTPEPEGYEFAGIIPI